MAINTPTSQPWDPNSTVTINELVTNRIKSQQQTNLCQFPVRGFPTDSKALFNIPVEDFDNILVDGLYNRAVEDFNYKKLYENVKRRGGFEFESSSGIKAFQRPDKKIYLVDGVHRTSFCVVNKIPVYMNLHIHPNNWTVEQCRVKEAQVYTDLSYHQYSQNAEQNFKAAYVAKESWAIELADLLKQIGLHIKTIGDSSGPRLTGYKTFQDTVKECGEVAALDAGNLLSDFMEDRNSINALLISGLTVLTSLKDDFDFKDRYLTKAIAAAIGSKGFLKGTTHGKPTQGIALRMAHLYNNQGNGMKQFKSIDMASLCTVFDMPIATLQADNYLITV
jgi:hypothetical protein